MFASVLSATTLIPILQMGPLWQIG